MKCIHLCILLLVCGCSNIESPRNPKPDVLIQKVAIDNLSQAFDVVDVVSLKVQEDFFLGMPKRVIADGKGSFYIMDHDAQSLLFKYNDDGSLDLIIGSIGEGPGQYQKINDFSVDESGNVYILSPTQILKYDKEGTYLGNAEINYSPLNALFFGGQLYVKSAYHRSSKDRFEVAVYSADLELVQTLGQFDPRLFKYTFLPWTSLAHDGESLYASSIYEFEIHQYQSGVNKQSFHFGAAQDGLDKLWQKEKLLEKDLAVIRNELHRFINVIGFDGGLYLYEYCRSKEISRHWLFNRETEKFMRLDGLHLLIREREMLTANQQQTLLSMIVGNKGDQLIAVIDDVPNCQSLIDLKPGLMQAPCSEKDLPLLVFLKPKWGEFEKDEPTR